MTRDGLIESLRVLAERAHASDHLPAAGVLFALCGAMVEGAELSLFQTCVPFTVAQVGRLRGEPDWSEDELRV